MTTKHGPVKTDHILFIASGAFHVAKPSDMLPELQGRLPIRVELRALTREDFEKILTEPENSLIKQYVAMMATENVDAGIPPKAGIAEIAKVSADVNASVENIGARPPAHRDGTSPRRHQLHRVGPQWRTTKNR